MRITRRSTLLGMAAFAAGTQSLRAAGEEPLTLWQAVLRTREARMKGDHAAWLEWALKAIDFAPEHVDFRLSAARACGALGKTDEAVSHLAVAVRRGAGFDPAKITELAGLSFAGEHEELPARARRNLEPVSRATMLAEVPGRECEGIAFDPVSKRLFTGSADGQVFAIDPVGKVSIFAEGLRQVLGLKVDTGRKLLFAVDGRFPDLFAAEQASPDIGKTGIVAFDLDSGRKAQSWELDDPGVLHGFNDIAIAATGDLFITDTPAQAVYRLDMSAGSFELIHRDTAMSFPNGIVLTPDDSALIVASVEGLNAIDLSSRTASRLPVAETVCVNSIDGLGWLGSELVGVQGSPYLARLARVSLAGAAVSGVSALNARTPAQYNNTTCAVGDDAVYLIGGSPAADPNGGPPLAEAPRPQVLRVPLAA